RGLRPSRRPPDPCRRRASGRGVRGQRHDGAGLPVRIRAGRRAGAAGHRARRLRRHPAGAFRSPVLDHDASEYRATRRTCCRASARPDRNRCGCERPCIGKRCGPPGDGAGTGGACVLRWPGTSRVRHRTEGEHESLSHQARPSWEGAMKRLATDRPVRSALSIALAGCLLLGSGAAMAQSTGATIRGQVNADSAPAAGATITAVNTATGLRRTVQASPEGRYSLAGLPPGTYRVQVDANGQSASQELTVQVGQTATVDLGVGGLPESGPTGEATTMETVQVTAQAAVETRTSEVASYVSQKQIQALPQNTRNFLAF